MKSLRVGVLVVAAFAVGLSQPWTLIAQSGRPGTIQEADLRQFLAYIASDTLLGRQTFTEGYGLAAGYVAAHLEQWHVKPLGDNGTYFQTVKLNDVKIVGDNSTVTLEINGQSKTFKNGQGVRFATPLGGKQTIASTGVEFLGYGLYLDDHNDYAGRNARGKPAVWINGTPSGVSQGAARLLDGRARHAVAEAFASASVSYIVPSQTAGRAAAAPATPEAPAAPATAAPAPGGRGAAGARGPALIANTVLSTAARGDFRTPDNINRLNPPQITGDDAFFEFLFTGAPQTFAEIKNLAANHQPLPRFSLPAVTMTFNVDATYQVLQTLYTHNVVGAIEGTDAARKDTYVAFGAHLDHIGYSAAPRAGAPAAAGAAGGTGAGRGAGRCPNAAPGDVINNGADDDGSGTVTELAIAKAFATGPKPRRSLLFIWHAGEELGLYGSRYNADFPVVPLEKIDVQLNMDMIGRDNWDNRDANYRNSVFVIGDDRISTDLHNIIVDTNARLKEPLRLDYEMNDATDPEAVYYRSDHYSYASKGIPIAFFTDGFHNDYHCVSDTADKIAYAKMARIGQLAYQTGFAIANMDQFLERDNLGPRSGKGFQGKINKK